MSQNKKLQKEQTVLRQIREALEMKQTDFAHFLKVTPATISSCETGKTEMVLTFEQWRRLATLMKFRLGFDVLEFQGQILLSEKKPINLLSKVL